MFIRDWLLVILFAFLSIISEHFPLKKPFSLTIFFPTFLFEPKWNIGKKRVNPFVPNAPFRYSLKTLENLTVKGCIGYEWVSEDTIEVKYSFPFFHIIIYVRSPCILEYIIPAITNTVQTQLAYLFRELVIIFFLLLLLLLLLLSFVQKIEN